MLGRQAKNVVYRAMGKPKFATDVLKSVPKRKEGFGPADLGLPTMPYADKDKNLISPNTRRILRVKGKK